VSWRAALDEIGQARFVTLDISGRRPGRPDVLAADAGVAGPGLAGFADAHRIADGAAVAHHGVEPALIRPDDDGAGRIAIVTEGDDLARLGRLGRCEDKEGGSG